MPEKGLRNYLHGDAYFLEQPIGDAESTMKFVVQTSPGPVARGRAPAHNGVFQAYT